MKQLSILRHAKAERPEAYDIDTARPLTKRGFKDAALIGDLLNKLQPAVDWIVSSPALRTRQTTETVLKSLSHAPQLMWHDAVYSANLAALLDTLQQIPPAAEHALLVGHNPGMEELTSALCTGAGDRLHLHMATATLVTLRLEVHTWSQVRPGSGMLLAMIRPSFIRKNVDMFP